jgi:hypothetical protein
MTNSQELSDDSEGRESIPRPARLVPHGVYSELDLCHNLQLSKNTIRKWRQLKVDPLVPLPTNTRQAFYLGEDVIDFWRRRK